MSMRITWEKLYEHSLECSLKIYPTKEKQDIIQKILLYCDNLSFNKGKSEEIVTISNKRYRLSLKYICKGKFAIVVDSVSSSLFCNIFLYKDSIVVKEYEGSKMSAMYLVAECLNAISTNSFSLLYYKISNLQSDTTTSKIDVLFKKYFYNTGKTLNDTYKYLSKEGFTHEEICQCILKSLGTLTWED